MHTHACQVGGYAGTTSLSDFGSKWLACYLKALYTLVSNASRPWLPA
jgi:hypothetical protein